MRGQHNFYKVLLDKLYEGVYICNNDMRITYWNQTAETITGYKAKDILGLFWWDLKLLHYDMHGNALSKPETNPLSKSLKNKAFIDGEVYFKHKDGHLMPITIQVSPIKDEKDRITGAVEIFNNNRYKISSLQRIDKLKKMAFLDSLTQVANRRYTQLKLHTRLEESKLSASNIRTGVLFMDVDHFKNINDEYGHEVGDKILKLVAATISENVRESDFVGRWGGEEFVVVMSDADEKSLETVANKIKKLMEATCLYSNSHSIHATVSIGAVLSKREDNAATLLKRADLLMYRSKQDGRNRITFG